MAEGGKSFQAFGYPDEQFETVISESLHCSVCSCVFKDPVMCKNEHCFCRGCITQHLENYHTCPCCNQDLTEETLADAPRFLRNLLSEQRIRCDHHERGCQEIVQLGNLASHVAVCGKAPVLCENEKCSSEINREDQFRHQGEECKFRKENCRNCKELSSKVQEIRTSLGGLREHVDVLNTSFEHMKSGLTAMEKKIKEIETAATSNATQASLSSESKDTKHPKQCGYLVAGGENDNTAEVFDKSSNRWRQLPAMKESRAYASSELYNGAVLVTGGTPDDKRVKSSIEQCNFYTSPFVPACWSKVAVKLPRPLRQHCTVVYHDGLVVLGGGDENEDSDFIYEVQLHSPFNTKILAKFPAARPTRGCGAVLVNDKIFIFGGGGRGYGASSKVTMYDIRKNEFKDLEPLPYGVCNMATVKYGENVILAGGTSQYNSHRYAKNKVISYNIKTQKSTELPPMKNSRSECRAVVDGNSLVVMGGRYEGMYAKKSVEVFDFNTSKWSDLPAMINGRYAFIAEIV